MLHIYIDQSRRLCEQHRRGALSDSKYSEALAQLGERFGALVRLQQRLPV